MQNPRHYININYLLTLFHFLADVNTVDEDGDDIPYAEAHEAVFVLSDDTNSTHLIPPQSNSSHFGPNVNLNFISADESCAVVIRIPLKFIYY